jgi:phosphatidylinositol glycan class N
MAGGGLMTVVGLAYMVLEDFILSDFTSFKTKSKRLHTSRTLLGIQVN